MRGDVFRVADRLGAFAAMALDDVLDAAGGEAGEQREDAGAARGTCRAASALVLASPIQASTAFRP